MTSLASLPSVFIRLEKLRISKLNPRQHYVELPELGASLKQQQLHAIVVRPDREAAGHFEIADGARRYKGAKAAGMDGLFAKVADLNDGEMLDIILGTGAEGNVSSLTPIEEAAGYESARKLLGITIDELAARFHRPVLHVHRRISLLGLSAEAQKSVTLGEMPATTAWLVARIPEKSIRDECASAVLNSPVHGGVMSFREAEAHIRTNICRPLQNAPFRIDDPALLPEAGACAKYSAHDKTLTGICPHNAATDRETYGDQRGRHTCMSPACFTRKAEAARKRVMEAEIAAGKKPLPPEINAEVFPEGEKTISWRSDYVPFVAPIPRDLLKPEVTSAPTWKDLLGEKAPQVWVGFNQAGSPVDLIQLGEAMVAVPKDEVSIFEERARRKYTMAAASDRPDGEKPEKRPRTGSSARAPSTDDSKIEEEEGESWQMRATDWIGRVIEAEPTLPPGLRDAGFNLLREVGASTLTQHA